MAIGVSAYPVIQEMTVVLTSTNASLHLVQTTDPALMKSMALTALALLDLVARDAKRISTNVFKHPVEMGLVLIK